MLGPEEVTKTPSGDVFVKPSLEKVRINLNPGKICRLITVAIVSTDQFFRTLITLLA